MKQVLDANVFLFVLFVLLTWIVCPTTATPIILFSYFYHFLNLQAFLTRRSDSRRLLIQSLGFRIIAFSILAYLLMPYLDQETRWSGVALLALGVVLHSLSVAVLGLDRTYYRKELDPSHAQESEVTKFPYNLIPHPMALGSLMQFMGLLLINPNFSEAYGYLLYGHILLTILTAMIEHYDWHLKDYFFRAQKGSFTDAQTRATVDRLRDWILNTFRGNLHTECSMHRYIKTLPTDVVAEIDKVRFADDVMAALRQAFPGAPVVPLSMTDELYISRYNIDRGGDQGLFDKHHDGNLRFLPGVSVVRSLLYLSSEDQLEVVFESSDLRACMKTYDFGILDFHKELHWVDGRYDPEKPPRILLKCNYLIDHWGLTPYRWLCIQINLLVFYVVKGAMEYSKSPKTFLQRVVGFGCNAFRLLNNVNPIAPVAVVMLAIVVSIRIVLYNVSTSF